MAKSNRELVTEEIGLFLEHAFPGTGNREMYTDYLNAMSEKDFKAYIGRLHSQEETITATLPINSEFKVTYEHMMKVAKKINHDFYQKLILTDPETGQEVITPIKHYVIDIVLRRQVQMFWKKISTAENARKRNILTGQATNESKGSAFSYPEANALKGRGMNKTLIEFMKGRGGDGMVYSAANDLIARDGKVNISDLLYLPSRATAVDTLSAYLTAMHLRNNLKAK